MLISWVLRDLSEISRRGWGMETEGGSQLFETQKGKVMQMYARDHIEVHPQKKKEVPYLVKKNVCI